MKPRPSKLRHIRGITLTETLVYCFLFGIVVNFSSAIFFKVVRQTRDMRRAGNQVAAALNAGERWREDVRSAAAPIGESQETNGTDSTTRPALFTISSANGPIVYSLKDGAIWRTVGDGPREALLRKVVSVDWISERRDGVLAWRWEIELFKSSRDDTPVKPLFSFLAIEPTRP